MGGRKEGKRGRETNPNTCIYEKREGIGNKWRVEERMEEPEYGRGREGEKRDTDRREGEGRVG